MLSASPHFICMRIERQFFASSMLRIQQLLEPVTVLLPTLRKFRRVSTRLTGTSSLPYVQFDPLLAETLEAFQKGRSRSSV